MGRGTSSAEATRKGIVRSGRRSDPKPRPGKEAQKRPAVAEELTPALGRVFIQTVLHFCPELPQWLAQLNDTRFQDLVVYDKKLLFWYALLLFVCKLSSLRQLDFQFRRMPEHVLPNLNRLAGTRQKTLPLWKTVSHLLGHVGLKAVCEIRICRSTARR